MICVQIKKLANGMRSNHGVGQWLAFKSSWLQASSTSARNHINVFNSSRIFNGSGNSYLQITNNIFDDSWQKGLTAKEAKFSVMDMNLQNLGRQISFLTERMSFSESQLKKIVDPSVSISLKNLSYFLYFAAYLTRLGDVWISIIPWQHKEQLTQQRRTMNDYVWSSEI